MPPKGPHTEHEDDPWTIQIPDHPKRTDSPTYTHSRARMNTIAKGIKDFAYGDSPYEDHHGGGLWLKDADGWFLVRNVAGIEWSAQFCADPAKVDALRRNARRLYAAFPDAVDELGIRELLDTPITDAAGVAAWTDSICNASVPLPKPRHVGVVPGATTGGVHHYPSPITEIDLFRFDDFDLWVETPGGGLAAVVPVAERGSGDGRTRVLMAAVPPPPGQAGPVDALLPPAPALAPGLAGAAVAPAEPILPGRPPGVDRGVRETASLTFAGRPSLGLRKSAPRRSHSCESRNGIRPNSGPVRVFDTPWAHPYRARRWEAARGGCCARRRAGPARECAPIGLPAAGALAPVNDVDVRLVQVTKAFGDALAVDHIDLEVLKGEFFSLLGPSGCGKTTTLRMIGGFEQPTSGLIELAGNGRHVAAAVPAARQHRLPELRPVPAPDDLGERRVRPPPDGRQGLRDQEPRHGHAQARRAAGLREAQADPDLGRPGAAGRARARAHQPARRAPPRRAAGRPRPQAAQADAGRAQAHPAGGRDHVHLRDPRPGGGDDDVQSDRRHEQGSLRAAGRPGDALRAPDDALRGRLPGREQPPRAGCAEGTAGRLRA